MDKYVVEIKNLTKIYKNQLAVDKINLHIKKGTIYGLLGRNGAGKTTIMKCILGLTAPSAGSVSVFGQSLPKDAREVYPRIGAIIETPGFYPNLTGTENLEIFAKLRGTTKKNAVKEALEVVGLPYKDKKLFSKYSLGMKQRLGIANAIMHDPELLILDEPINGLDPIGIAEIRDFLKRMCEEQGKTILISSHILSEIDVLADDIGIIHKGKMLEENSMEELKKKNRKYIQFRVSSTAAVSRVLEQHFHEKEYEYQIVDDSIIRIYDTSINLGEVNKVLITNELDVYESKICEESLEDYFKEITGGEGIA
ncbi:ABC transporter ATP-binding protein [Dorea longicatena]|uniref:ABC transporter ATP-binding protein n=1 Tax=Dorea longicatena TaxID=88431 RepID=UPI0003F7E63D|nr:ABC transporter ATP-binding protein [Dorea longicatena]